MEISFYHAIIIVLSTAVQFKPVKHCETSRRNAEELSPLLLRDQHSYSTFQVSQECQASIQTILQGCEGSVYCFRPLPVHFRLSFAWRHD